MRASVVAAFPGFTTRFEGRLPYMYTDVKGLVTTGVGNLIDPIAAALGLPWKRADGSAASSDEVMAEWNRVKQAWPGVQSTGDRSITSLHLDDADIDALVASKARSNEATLRSQFPSFDTWPADAQLALHSMAWAQGAGFQGWPHLRADLNAQPPDFQAAAGTPDADPTDPANRGDAWLNDAGNPGLRPRNVQTKLLWQNAARVQAGGLDPETLYWPQAVPAGATGGGGGFGAGGASMAARFVAELLIGAAISAAVGYAAWAYSPKSAPWKAKALALARRVAA